MSEVTYDIFIYSADGFDPVVLHERSFEEANAVRRIIEQRIQAIGPEGAGKNPGHESIILNGVWLNLRFITRMTAVKTRVMTTEEDRGGSGAAVVSCFVDG